MPKYPPYDLYVALEVAPKATTDVIHAAYRALAMLHKGDQKKLLAMNTAKDVLLDPVQRADYDAFRTNAGPKTIGSYKVLNKIAEGGFGVTYKGEHITLGTPVCIKHASKVSPQDEAIILEEARTIWDLRHFGIPSIRDIFRLHDGSMALVMSYVPGPTLAQLIDKHKRIDPESVAWITQRLLNILKYLHCYGVVHGDIKPGNIIVQEEQHSVVLVDYGLSLLKPSGKTLNKGYTEVFAAPEQLRSSPLIPQTDMYGLGMTMIALLGGDILAKRVPSSTPTNLCNFIKKLIRFDVLARPDPQAEDLQEEIRKVRLADFGREASGMKPLKA
jgi:serine/threonine protein kinase